MYMCSVTWSVQYAYSPSHNIYSSEKFHTVLIGIVLGMTQSVPLPCMFTSQFQGCTPYLQCLEWNDQSPFEEMTQHFHHLVYMILCQVLQVMCSWSFQLEYAHNYWNSECTKSSSLSVLFKFSQLPHCHLLICQLLPIWCTCALVTAFQLSVFPCRNCSTHSYIVI